MVTFSRPFRQNDGFVVSRERDRWRAVLIVRKISANDLARAMPAVGRPYNSALILSRWGWVEAGASFFAPFPSAVLN